MVILVMIYIIRIIWVDKVTRSLIATAEITAFMFEFGVVSR